MIHFKLRKLHQGMLNIGSLFYVSTTIEHFLLLFQFAESLVSQVILHCTEKGTGCSVSDSQAELQHVKNSIFFRCDVSLVAKGNSFWHLLKIHLVKNLQYVEPKLVDARSQQM